MYTTIISILIKTVYFLPLYPVLIWIYLNIDCRTPICNQGYYFPQQQTYVDGARNTPDFMRFLPFMGNATFAQRLQWPYSNPKYDISFEKYTNVGVVVRKNILQGGLPYAGPSDWSSGQHQKTYQGGSRKSYYFTSDCSVAYTLNMHIHILQYIHPLTLIHCMYSA